MKVDPKDYLKADSRSWLMLGATVTVLLIVLIVLVNILIPLKGH